MAFQTGSQINPALGAINYTPYLQGSLAGSQAIGQGIANLGQGIASGIEQYRKKQEDKQLSEALFSKTKQLVNENPELSSILPFNVNDPKEFGITVKAAGGPQAAAALLVNIGQQVQTRKEDNAVGAFINGADVTQNPKISKIFTDNPYLMTRAVAEKTNNDIKIAQLDQLRTGTALSLEEAKLKQREALAKNISMFLVGKTDSQKADILSQAGIDPITSQTALGFAENAELSRSKTEAEINKANAEAQAAAAKAKSAGFPTPQAGYRWKINSSGNLTGEQEVIPGGPVALEQTAAEAVAKEALPNQVFSIQNNLNKIAEAANLANNPSFFPASGLGSGVMGFFRGSAANDLKSALTSIQSSLALDKIIELKRANPKSGSTGLGALNMKELEALQSEIANLSQEQSTDRLLQGLKSVYRKIGMAVDYLPEQYRFNVPTFEDAISNKTGNQTQQMGNSPAKVGAMANRVFGSNK
jgi:hypothetical protein